MVQIYYFHLNQPCHQASDNDYKQAGDMYEIYVTDPGEVANTAKWQTDIYIPVQKKTS